MGLGILESRKTLNVPGTARLEDRLDAGTGLQFSTNHDKLKRAPNGIILIPQPSDDPNDPLNWPLWRRDAITALLCMLAVLASTLSPLLAANTMTLLFWYGNRSITEMALLTGYHLLGVAIAGFVFVATARVWGKRHSFLIGTVIIIISCIWGGLSGKNYDSMVAARFFQGVGLAPFEACINASVGDLYCVHERGKRMALTNLCLFGGAFFTPVIVGVTTHNLGWEWVYFLVSIFSAAVLPLVYFFCPETTYVRDTATPQPSSASAKELRNISSSSASSGWNESQVSIDTGHGLTAAKIREASSKRIEDISQTSLELDDSIYRTDTEAHKSMQPIPWVSRKSLRLFNGRKTPESFFQLLVRPLPLFFHPAILWACLIQGTLIAWTALLGVILAVVMLQPPLNFDEVKTGYMYTGAFVGALVGFILSGLITDWSTRWLSKRNNGIFEPEFRLVLVIPQLFFGCIGLYGFGIASANTAKYGWLLPDVFFGFVTCGMIMGAVASALYITDAYAEIEVEGFTCLLIFKNMITFGLTFKAFDWLLEAGIYKLMFSSASIQIVILMLTIPMYIFGKRVRAFYYRHNMLKLLHLQ